MSDHQNEPKNRLLSFKIAVLIASIIWIMIVIISGAGINITGVEWNFARTGALGDSFGFFSAMMAGLAALFAYNTLVHERMEAHRLRERERERDKSERLEMERLRQRETARDKAVRKREAEGTFFRLVTLRNTIISDFTTRRPPIVNGTDALERIYLVLSSELKKSENRGNVYNNFYRLYKNDLGHYFRFTYHLIKFVTENFDDDHERYTYIRLLRAQISNGEQGLIALNCLYGQGRGQFKNWVEKFALLHNFDDQDRIDLNLDAEFSLSAFDSTSWSSETINC